WFLYTSWDESPISGNDTYVGLVNDSITGGDRIDMSSLDGNIANGSYTPGNVNSLNTKIKWLRDATFASQPAGTAGYARYNPSTGMVEASNDTDSQAEFRIYVGTGWNTSEAKWQELERILGVQNGYLNDTVAPTMDPL